MGSETIDEVVPPRWRRPRHAAAALRHTRSRMTHRTLRRLALTPLVVASALALSSCSSSPVNAAGSWTLNVTNGANGCMIDTWTEGQSSSGVPLTITQEGSAVTGELGGAWATASDLLLGSHTFTGDVNGDAIDMRITGRAASSGGCAYTTVVDLTGTISGDTITGSLVWSADTNASADCGYLATCESVQSMNGARPPSGS